MYTFQKTFTSEIESGIKFLYIFFSMKNSNENFQKWL